MEHNVEKVICGMTNSAVIVQFLPRNKDKKRNKKKKKNKKKVISGDTK